MSDTMRPKSKDRERAAVVAPRRALIVAMVTGAVLVVFAIGSALVLRTARSEAEFVRVFVWLTCGAVALSGVACGLIAWTLFRVLVAPTAGGVRATFPPPVVSVMTAEPAPVGPEAGAGALTVRLGLLRDVSATEEAHPQTLASPRPALSSAHVLDQALSDLSDARRFLATGNCDAIGPPMGRLKNAARSAELDLVAQASEALEGLARIKASPRHIAVAIVGLSHVVETLRRQAGMGLPVPSRKPSAALRAAMEAPPSKPTESGMRRAVRVRP